MLTIWCPVSSKGWLLLDTNINYLFMYCGIFFKKQYAKTNLKIFGTRGENKLDPQR